MAGLQPGSGGPAVVSEDEPAMVDAEHLVATLVAATAKACELAIAIRRSPAFSEMVKRKADRQKGAETTVDLVSLADLLIQRIVQEDVVAAIPSLHGRVLGEEDCTFFDAKTGESVSLEVIPKEKAELKALLTRIFPSHMDDVICAICSILTKTRAEFLVGMIHDKMVSTFDANDIVVWVDPLDSTSAYVKGKMPDRGGEIQDESGALPSTTVLVGAFIASTGVPVCGVIGHPFSTHDGDAWTSRLYWGLIGMEDGDDRATGVIPAPAADEAMRIPKSCVIVRSKSEDETVVDAIESSFGAGATLIANGAGYKLLTLIRGLSTAYYLGLPTTYPWDTCGPHAIIRALGGDVVDARNGKTIRYSTDRSAHQDGVIASLDLAIIDQLVASTVQTAAERSNEAQ